MAWRTGLPGDASPRKHPSDPFLLGKTRSLSEYEAFADVCFKDRFIGGVALRGGAPDEDYFVAPEEGGQAAIEAKCTSHRVVQPQG